MATWTNDDGLLVRFGNSAAEVAAGGSFASNSGQTVTEITIDFNDLGAAAAVVDYNIGLPSGARIEKMEFVVETAFTSGGAATLDIGLIRQDLTTELDYNGIVAAAALGTINAAGETTEFVLGTTGAGALIGTTLANAGIVTVNYGTAAFTAGKGSIRIFHRVI